MNETSDVPVGKLILVPAVITFAITLLRLFGELQHWSPRFFNPAAGGGGALVGIVWLVPLLGIIFAVQLRNRGYRPASFARAFGFPLLALLAVLVVVVPIALLKLSPIVVLLVSSAMSIVAVVIAMKGWPALGKTLLAYALAARIPVAVLMLVAMFAKWGTHYDVGPPELDQTPTFVRWVLIGLLPQLTAWIAFTLIIGGFVGAVTAVALGRPRTVDTARTSPAVG